MQSTGLLYTISQIAVGLAGFSAVIMTLNPRPIREWDDTDRLNLRLLLQISIYVIFFSLLPPLLSVSFENHLTWLCALWAYGLIHIADATFFLTKLTNEIPTLFRNAAICGVIVAVTQLVIAWQGNDIAREQMFIFALIWHLGVVFMAFILLLYQLRKNE
jgi:hypothetical protein